MPADRAAARERRTPAPRVEGRGSLLRFGLGESAKRAGRPTSRGRPAVVVTSGRRAAANGILKGQVP